MRASPGYQSSETRLFISLGQKSPPSQGQDDCRVNLNPLMVSLSNHEPRTTSGLDGHPSKSLGRADADDKTDFAIVLPQGEGAKEKIVKRCP